MSSEQRGISEQSPQRPARATQVAAITVTLAITFHWIPDHWWHYSSGLLGGIRGMWGYALSTLTLGLALTVWSPREFGLVWAKTWQARRVVYFVGGGTTVVACVAMLFIRTPFQGGDWAIFLCVPLAEELLFRGFIFGVLAEAFPRVITIGKHWFSMATLLSAVAFGLWHLGGLDWPDNGFILFQVCYTTVAGFLSGIIRDRTESLVASWLVHATVNAWAVFVPSWWWVV